MLAISFAVSHLTKEIEDLHLSELSKRELESYMANEYFKNVRNLIANRHVFGLHALKAKLLKAKELKAAEPGRSREVLAIGMASLRREDALPHLPQLIENF